MRQDKQKLTNQLAIEYVKLTNISLKSIREPKQKFTGNFFNIVKKISKNYRKISEVRYKNDVARSFAYTLTKIIDYI